MTGQCLREIFFNNFQQPPSIAPPRKALLLQPEPLSDMLYACIDLGNTSAKMALYRQGQEVWYGEQLGHDQLREQLDTWRPDRVAYARVGADHTDLAAWLQARFEVTILTWQTPVPVQVRYQTPETLGMDRLAAVIGAWHRYPGQTALVIDLGTCITYDLITADGQYLGGGISPGMHMRFRAMHHFTAKLPLTQPQADVPLVGQSTVSCLQSGVIHGITAEIDGIVANYTSEWPDLQVILCGGDAVFFEKRIKPANFADQKLVLLGLHCILTDHAC